MVLAFWAFATVAGVTLADQANDRLQGTDLRIPGTESDRAAALTERQFGSTISIAVLLKGEPGLLLKRGPSIARRLGKIEGVSVLSPWASGGERTLREPAGQALLTLQVARPFDEIANQTAPAVERLLDQAVDPPLTYEMTGLAPLVRALNNATLDAVRQGELIALPVLLILLLLIFRSPLAALVPAACGLVVTTLGTAVLGMIGGATQIDALALSVVTMIGLALGVDYSLLIVSRFREELARGASVGEAIEEAVARAGRTVLFAGAALVIGMLGPFFVAPGGLLVSATLGVIVATVLAVMVALLMIPAALGVLGTGVNKWQIGAGTRDNFWLRFSRRALARPGVAALVVTLPLLALSASALALDTGPPNVKNLPPDDNARKSYEAFERSRGAGWSTPYEITFSSPGPITTTKRLKELKRFQRKVSKTPGVEAVLGPAALLDRAELLRRQSDTSQATSQLRKLSKGLRRAGDGTSALLAGIGAAAGGSSQLASGAQSATPQTQMLADGSRRIADGSRRARDGSAQIDRAAAKLGSMLLGLDSSAESGLVNPLDRAQTNVQEALRRLSSASPAASEDPAVQRARAEIQAALAELATLDTNIGSHVGELSLSTAASRELSRATGSLSGGLDELAAGTRQAAGGASALAQAFPQLNSGLGALSLGLAGAFTGTGQLSEGVMRLSQGIDRAKRTNSRRLAELRRAGISVDQAAGSGYFVLAGVEGAKRETQTNISFALNTSNGGNTARVMVVPTAGAFDPKGGELTPVLQRATRDAARKMDATGLVGGPAVLLSDFDNETTSAVPWVILALVVLTFLVLQVAFRSVVLALIAVLLNLLTVGAAVGVMMLLFQADSPPLGGPGYLDAIALSGIVGIIFGLSIDYEVFLISRMLEGRALTGTTEGAIAYGLEKTTRIITGAALIMVGVFLAFALAPVANIRQFGVGLTVAVILDATVVRLVLLPAMIRLVGERAWPKINQAKTRPAPEV